ncbi:hypothetical protein IAR55_000268 [Kwoniella newhampshirensis]|uniref:Alcohol dehydrogenase-like C-terminal domain-containing protein n=1 Tax=Kwoniella newhampshirensis TaxID=1651941 RepID=A0AAW0Z6R2_9TREE
MTTEYKFKSWAGVDARALQGQDQSRIAIPIHLSPPQPPTHLKSHPPTQIVVNIQYCADSRSKSGFAKYWRGPYRSAIQIPEALDPAVAVPMLCGGVTVFSPLERVRAGTKAETVDAIGIGGLGHFAILFARALGTEVTAISSHYIASVDDVSESDKGHERPLDLIFCTLNPSELVVTNYFPLLRSNDTLVLVGIIPTPLQVPLIPLFTGQIALAGSVAGSPDDIRKMLDFAADKKIKAWINKRDMNDINRALPAFRSEGSRYRYVLVNKEQRGQL